MGQSSAYSDSGSVAIATASAGAVAVSSFGSSNTAVARATGSANPVMQSLTSGYSASFHYRSTASGVVRYWDFNDSTSLNSGIDQNVLSDVNDYGNLTPILDTAIMASGVSSMRIDRFSQSTSDGGGSWLGNFSPDLLTRFGENTEFFVQMRVRWSAALRNTVFYIDKFATGFAATFINGNTFSVVGDKTAIYTAHLGVRARKVGGIPIGHGIITSSTYDGTKTTVTLNLNQGTLTGIIQADYSSGGGHWQVLAAAPTVVDAQTLTFVGDQTANLRGVRFAVRVRDASENIIAYSVITALSYSSGTNLTTCVVRVTQGTLVGAAGVDCNSTVQGGKKFFDVVAQDSFVGSTPDAWGITKYGSSDGTKLVIQSQDQHPNPTMYRIYDGGTSNLQPSNGAGDSYEQNAIVNTVAPVYCLRNVNNSINAEEATPGCWTMPPDEWVTLQLGVTLGPKNATYVEPSDGHVLSVWNPARVRLWAARYNQPSTLLIDYNNTVLGYKPLSTGPSAEDERFGKIYCFPYLTDQDAMQTNAYAPAWYDEVIVSTTQIADPYNGPLDSLLPTNVRDLGSIVNPDPNIVAGINITDDSGVIIDNITKALYIFGGGHGAGMETDIRKFDLTTLQWSSLYQSTPYNSVAMAGSNINQSMGQWSVTTVPISPQPTARHTYNMQVVSPNGVYYCMQSQGQPYPWGTTDYENHALYWGGHMWSYNLNTGVHTWSKYGRPGDPFPVPWYTQCSAMWDVASSRILVMGTDVGGSGFLWGYCYDPAADNVTTAYNSRSTIVLNQGGDLIYVNGGTGPGGGAINDKYYIVQGRDGRVWTFDFNRTTFQFDNMTQLTVTGVPSQDWQTAPTTLGRSPGALQYDPNNNIIGGYTSFGKFNAFHLDTNTWTTHQMVTEGTGANSNVGQAVQCLDFDRQSGCFIFLSSPPPEGNGHIWAYRYA